MVIVLLAACPAIDDTAKDSDTDTGSSVMTEWTSAGVTVTIPAAGGTDGVGYYFGLAQTGVDGGWAGEDCLDSIPAGYEYMDDGGYQLCHPLSRTGGTLTTVATPEEIVEGATTLLGMDMQDTVTYVLIEASGPPCYVWGDDPAYYAGLACTVL